MSNNFPSVPADFALASLEYDVAFPPPVQVAPSLTFEGVSTIPTGPSILSSGNSLMIFTFSTPGDFGSFDQDQAEAEVIILLNDLCQFLSDATGAPLATVKGAVQLTRRWTWTNAAGNTATYTDAVAYPA